MAMSDRTKKVFLCTLISVVVVAVALGVNGMIRSKTSQMELLSQGQVEYYEGVFERYELEVTTEEFMKYCVETDREQVNDQRLIINYDCTLDSLEEVLPACKELRYVSVSQEENYPEMLRISYEATMKMKSWCAMQKIKCGNGWFTMHRQMNCCPLPN